MNRLRSKLTYANVISTLALFLVLAGGTAFAAKQMLPKNSVGTKQIKNSTVTGAKIKNGAVTGAKIAAGSITGANINLSSLGTVPSASQAANAAHATSADSAGHAATADSADALAAPEPVNFVTQFVNGFENYGNEFERAGYYRDRQCGVHLQGVISGGNGTAFTLPPGFRPAEDTFSAVTATGDVGYIEVLKDGEVELKGGLASNNWGFSGTTFRAAGC